MCRKWNFPVLPEVSADVDVQKSCEGFMAISSTAEHASASKSFVVAINHLH